MDMWSIAIELTTIKEMRVISMALVIWCKPVITIGAYKAPKIVAKITEEVLVKPP